MAGLGILGTLESILYKYGENDEDYYIKLTNILGELEFQTCKGQYKAWNEKPIADRMREYFETQNELTQNLSYQFLCYSLVHLIDGYFKTFIEYHGMHAIAALEYLNDSKIFPNAEKGIFNSATPEQILSKGYYSNLLRSKNTWEDLVLDFRRELEHMTFTPTFSDIKK